MDEFKPNKIVRESVSKQVFFEIKKRISEGYWQPGEKLPSENELADAFGVSRLSVRSALQALSALKIIKIKNGDGTYVRKFEISNVFDNVADMMTLSVSAEEFNEYRYFFESACIRLIEKRKPAPKDFSAMRQCLEEMEKAAEDFDYLTYNDWDYQFHQAFCELCGNRMFEYTNSLFASLMKHYYAMNVAGLGETYNSENVDWEKGIGYHRNFLESLQQEQYDRALALLASVTRCGADS